jgi:DNA-directed RNA polymerase subunit RPC12/RpoP
MNCRICQKELKPALGMAPKWVEWQNVNAICSDCRTNHGLGTTARPSMRPPVPCRTCGHTQLVRILLRERTGEYSSHVPLTLTYGIRHDPGGVFTTSSVEPDHSQPLGVLDAWVCRACGLTELYAREPASIPIGPEYATELVDVGARPPFR